MSRWWAAIAAAFSAIGLAHAAVSSADDTGRVISLAQPAQRIVSLSPHATELLYALGAGSRVVGRDSASDYPAEALHLPAVGQYGAFNVESILALRPDLVIAWEGPQAGPATQRLRALGIPVFASEPDTVDKIPATMRSLGHLMGLDTAAETNAKQFEADWHALEARYARAKTLSVIPQVGDDPAMTVNDHQFVAAVFRACGTHNPYGADAAPVPLLSVEHIAVMQPSAIVALVDNATVAARWQEKWRNLPLHAAYLWAPATTLGRPGPRLIPAARALCERLDQLRHTAKID